MPSPSNHLAASTSAMEPWRLPHVLGGDAEVDHVLSAVACRPNCSMETGLP